MTLPTTYAERPTLLLFDPSLIITPETPELTCYTSDGHHWLCYEPHNLPDRQDDPVWSGTTKELHQQHPDRIPRWKDIR